MRLALRRTELHIGVCLPMSSSCTADRGGVDQALSRRVKDGTSRRVRRGLYVRPRFSRLAGEYAVPIDGMVQAGVSMTGETIMVHGATAVRVLGFSA